MQTVEIVLEQPVMCKVDCYHSDTSVAFYNDLHEPCSNRQQMHRADRYVHGVHKSAPSLQSLKSFNG